MSAQKQLSVLPFVLTIGVTASRVKLQELLLQRSECRCFRLCIQKQSCLCSLLTGQELCFYGFIIGLSLSMNNPVNRTLDLQLPSSFAGPSARSTFNLFFHLLNLRLPFFYSFTFSRCELSFFSMINTRDPYLRWSIWLVIYTYFTNTQKTCLLEGGQLVVRGRTLQNISETCYFWKSHRRGCTHMEVPHATSFL